MADKKIIKKEISAVHWLLLSTSKLLIGVGLGLIIATHFWYVQPYWYLMVFIGAAVLILTFYNLMKIEGTEEIKLKKKLKK